ncbi:MAG TPA: ATPase, T2SS/T4P/T4SS family, partial [Gemmatimonadales bacterium]|nr:ATPase, T2SS/T4P/T4SS family [Gemmatimonadales bacterium]
MTAFTTVDLPSLTRLSERLTADYLEFNAVLPLRLQDGRVEVATWMPEIDPQVVDDLRFVFDAEVEVIQGPESDLRAAIRRVYGDDGVTAQGLIAGLGSEPAEQTPRAEAALDDLVHLANEAPVVRLVNLLLLEALEARASDVHLEGYADELRVRYRVDGVLQDGPAPPAHLAAAIISRLKIMADLDIAERRVPQDGRIRLRLQDRPVDVRVSTVPVLHGESIVLRLLDKDRSRVGLDGLG